MPIESPKFDEVTGHSEPDDGLTRSMLSGGVGIVVGDMPSTEAFLVYTRSIHVLLV